MLAAKQDSREKIEGVSDGSQRGKNGTYGWVMRTHDCVYSSSGKVRSNTRELNSYRSELHGVLSMMTGAWSVNSKAQVRSYCDNRSVVDGFKAVRSYRQRWERSGAKIQPLRGSMRVDRTLVSKMEATICVGMGEVAPGGA